MLAKLFLLASMCSYLLGTADNQITDEIQNKKQIVAELKIEIEEAKKIVGMVETMDIVEKIGYLRKLEEEIKVLEERLERLKGIESDSETQ